MEAIKLLKYRGENTNTTGGLIWARRVLTEPEFGARGNAVVRILILITDGQPNRATETLDQEIARIKSEDVGIFAIGITDSVSCLIY